MDELLVASTNRGKVREYEQLLGGLPLRLRSLAELDRVPPEPAEDADTFAENAIAKARAYARETGLTTLADDSGLEIAAFDGGPGVRTKRFFGDGISDEERNRRLLERLRAASDRSARFVCVIAVAAADGRVETFEGVCPGTIAQRPAGANGFGYDPVFVPDGYEVTLAQLPTEVKNRISHRGRAAAKLRARLASKV